MFISPKYGNSIGFDSWPIPTLEHHWSLFRTCHPAPPWCPMIDAPSHMHSDPTSTIARPPTPRPMLHLALQHEGDMAARVAWSCQALEAKPCHGEPVGESPHKIRKGWNHVFVTETTKSLGLLNIKMNGGWDYMIPSFGNLRLLNEWSNPCPKSFHI